MIKYDTLDAFGSALATQQHATVVSMIQEFGSTIVERWGAGKEIRLNGKRHMFFERTDSYMVRDADHDTDYDGIAPLYDELFEDESSAEQDAFFLSRLGELEGQRILDIGCGTGFLLDHRSHVNSPEHYTGIDPSCSMIRELLHKHDEANVYVSQFEEFADGKFDLIVSMYGSISYVIPAYLSRLEDMLNPGGRYVLVFFADHYYPKSCASYNTPSRHYPSTHALIPGLHTNVGNYVLVEGSTSDIRASTKYVKTWQGIH